MEASQPFKNTMPTSVPGDELRILKHLASLEHVPPVA